MQGDEVARYKVKRRTRGFFLRLGITLALAWPLWHRFHSQVIETWDQLSAQKVQSLMAGLSDRQVLWGAGSIFAVLWIPWLFRFIRGWPKAEVREYKPRRPVWPVIRKLVGVLTLLGLATGSAAVPVWYWQQFGPTPEPLVNTAPPGTVYVRKESERQSLLLVKSDGSDLLMDFPTHDSFFWEYEHGPVSLNNGYLRFEPWPSRKAVGLGLGISILSLASALGPLWLVVRRFRRKPGATTATVAVEIEKPSKLEKIEPSRRWREEEGVIHCALTSDGKSGEEWIAHFKRKGTPLDPCAECILRSEAFTPTRGRAYEVRILKGKSFVDGERTTKRIRLSAGNLKAAPIELACLILSAFPPEEMGATGLQSIIVMHDAVIVRGQSYLLATDVLPISYRRGISQCRLYAFSGSPNMEWHAYRGFAFVLENSTS